MLELLKKVMGDKREYRRMTARIKALPQDYRFVYEKIQNYMWRFTAGSGYDMIQVQGELLELFESGAAEGRPVLDVTGEDVAGFCDELLRQVKTYPGQWRKQLNREVLKQAGRREEK